MASIPTGVNTTNPSEKKPPTKLRWATGRPRILRLQRKKKLPTVRLGGESQLQGGGSGSVMVRMIRRIRVRWLKLKKACAPNKKMKAYNLCVVENPKENYGKRQQMFVMSSFGIPVMGLTFN